MMFGLYMAMMVNTAMITKTHIRYLNRLVALGFILLWGFLIVVQIYGNISILPKKKKGNYCSPSSVSIGSSVKASSSVGPLSVSEGEVQELPHCSHLQLYVLCVVVLVHPTISRDAKSVNKMFLILYKYIWWLILFAISLCWCFIVWGKYISRLEYTRSRH